MIRLFCSDCSLPADVLWGSFVMHSFRTSVGRLAQNISRSQVTFSARKYLRLCWREGWKGGWGVGEDGELTSLF